MDRDFENEQEQEELIALENLLGHKLSDFLDADYNYSISQVLSSVRQHLHKGPVDIASSSVDATKDVFTSISGTTSVNTPCHPVKGGHCITEYLTYSW